MVVLTSDASTAEVYLQGAHVTHFQRRGDEPLLFLSRASRFECGKAIRGGVPIIFPWFGDRPGCPAHGFARARPWRLVASEARADGTVCATFELFAAEGDPPFHAQYRVAIRDELALELRITNPAPDRTLEFEQCLHTYFAVGDIGSVELHGLQGARFMDKVAGGAIGQQGEVALRIAAETDRVYRDTCSTVVIDDPAWERRITVAKVQSQSTVVWNPWVEKSRRLADMAPEEYRRMLCVEVGNVGPNRMVLPAGQGMTMAVRIASAPLVGA